MNPHFLFSQSGKLVFYDLGCISIGLVEPYPEPAPISIPYADNSSHRYDSSAQTLRALDQWFGPERRMKGKR